MWFDWLPLVNMGLLILLNMLAYRTLRQTQQNAENIVQQAVQALQNTERLP